MLILSRRLGESIIIGDEIKVTISEINGSQVKLGIDAPRDIIVHREEIQEIADEISARIKRKGLVDDS